MQRRYNWQRSRSLMVTLSLCLGMTTAAGAVVPAFATTVQEDGAEVESVSKKAPDFPSVYPDSALKKLSKKEISKRVEALIKAMTQEEKFSLLGGDGSNSTSTKGFAGRLKGVPRLGVPYLEMHDGPSGVSYTEDTTNPPMHQLLAATWDKESAYNFGDIEGSEARAVGANAQLGSQFDITRVPQFGRAKDQMGEDSYLASQLSAEETKGIQDNNVVAVAKHYAAFAKNATPAQFTNIVVSEQALHETYLPAFESAVKAGAGGVMTSYGAVNDTKMSANKYLNVDVLRDMFGFEGFNITDWGGNDGFTMDKGTDIEMPQTSKNSQAAAEEKIASGEITQETVDNAVRHVLTAMGDAGYLGLVQVGSDGKAMEDPDAPDVIELKEDKDKLAQVRKTNSKKARSIAEKGGVLLKNEDNVLPLNDGESVAVAGIGGLHLLSGIGGERSYGTVAEMESPYEALADRMDDVTGVVGIDQIGEVIPNEYLYTSSENAKEEPKADSKDDEVSANSVSEGSAEKDEDDDKPVHGAVRAYGVKSEGSAGKATQGQTWGAASASTTRMMNEDGDFVAGELAAYDDIIDFNTGTNHDVDTFWHNSDDGNAFPQNGGKIAVDDEDGNVGEEKDGQSYTWTTYLKAPEDGKYSIILEGIGGTISAKVQGIDDNVSGSMSTASVREGEQWPSSSVTTETGMDISASKVELTEGNVYKITIEATTAISEKDMQVRLAWITPSQAEKNYEDAVEAAKKNDKTIVFVNYEASDTGSTGMGGMFGGSSEPQKVEDVTMRLDSEQEEFIHDLADAAHRNGKKIVVVLNNDTAVTMSDWIDDVDGLLEMYYPGQEGGIATAELLTGQVNPSGKLAYTIQKEDNETILTRSQEALDRDDTVVTRDDGVEMHNAYYDEGILTGYRWFDEEGIEPLYDFGYGLSYTTFEYSDMKVKEAAKDGEGIGYDVSFKITNTGDVEGSEVAQIYLGEADVPEGVQCAKYQLAGFERVEDIEPGETRNVTVHVSQRSLSYWNTDGELKENSEGVKDKWTVATGERKIYVAAAEDNLILESTIDVSDEAVTKTSVADAEVAAIEDQVYTGDAVKPSVTVTVDGKTLTRGKDYEVSYVNNTEVGTAKATITGIGDYTGTKTVKFRIAIFDGSQKLAPQSFTGKAVKLVIKNYSKDGKVYTVGKDYSLSYRNNKHAGEATVTIKWNKKSGRKGNESFKFTIDPVDAAETTIADIPDQKLKKGKAEPKLRISYGKKKLKKDKDFTVSYSDNKQSGTATAEVTFKGDYTGSKTVNFTIK